MNLTPPDFLELANRRLLRLALLFVLYRELARRQAVALADEQRARAALGQLLRTATTERAVWAEVASAYEAEVQGYTDRIAILEEHIIALEDKLADEGFTEGDSPVTRS